MNSVPRAPQFLSESATVYGVLLNFKSALAAMGGAVNQPPYLKPPRAPILYIKPPGCRIGSGDPIPVPDGASELLMNGTIGVVIGRNATRVSADAALDYVAGFMLANDVSLPEPSYFRPPLKQRCRDGFLPIGPRVSDRASLPDVARLEFRIFVNGELRCSASLGDMVRSMPQLIADVTEFMTLSAGDVLLVGSPADVPSAHLGDLVRVESDELGVLENWLIPERDLESPRFEGESRGPRQ